MAATNEAAESPGSTTTISCRVKSEELAAIDDAARLDSMQRGPWIKQAVVNASEERLRQGGRSAGNEQEPFGRDGTLKRSRLLIAAFAGGALGAAIGVWTAIGLTNYL